MVLIRERDDIVVKRDLGATPAQKFPTRHILYKI